MALTRVRAEQIVGLQGFPKAILINLIPSSNRPNTTGDFILEGAFFTPNMTVVVEGQTVNRKTFTSDNKVVLNLTTGSAEGTFDITINNGSGPAVFPNALFIVLGEVYEPVAAEWTSLIGGPNVSETGKFKLSTYDAITNGIWNKTFQFNLDYSVRWKFQRSALGEYPINYAPGHRHVRLVKASDSTPAFTIWYVTNHLGIYVYGRDDITGTQYSNLRMASGAAYNDDLALFEAMNLEFRVNSTAQTIGFYIDNVLKASFITPCTFDLKLRTDVRRSNVTDIKYIELA